MIGDSDPSECAPRAAYADRLHDPIMQRLKAISFLNLEIGKKIGETLGVNVTDMTAMELLIDARTLTPSQLASQLKVTTAAATQIVDRLERAGHVTRERKAVDRHKIFVAPVEASEARAFALLAPMLDALSGAVSGLDPAERRIIETFLDQVVDIYLQASGPPAPCPEPNEPDDTPSSAL